MKNLLREKLEKREVALGVLIEEPVVHITEILGLLGFDYLYIDCQHSPMSLESVANLIKAAELRGMTPWSGYPKTCLRSSCNIWIWAPWGLLLLT